MNPPGWQTSTAAGGKIGPLIAAPVPGTSTQRRRWGRRGVRLPTTAGIGALRLLCVLGTVSAFAVDVSAQACSPAERTLRFGFYAHFEPVSYSADPDPASPGIDIHRGYEADLLDRTRSDGGSGPVVFPARDRGGGITILESRTRDVDGGRRR